MTHRQTDTQTDTAFYSLGFNKIYFVCIDVLSCKLSNVLCQLNLTVDLNIWAWPGYRASPAPTGLASSRERSGPQEGHNQQQDWQERQVRVAFTQNKTNEQNLFFYRNTVLVLLSWGSPRPSWDFYGIMGTYIICWKSQGFTLSTVSLVYLILFWLIVHFKYLQYCWNNNSRNQSINYSVMASLLHSLQAAPAPI